MGGGPSSAAATSKLLSAVTHTHTRTGEQISTRKQIFFHLMHKCTHSSSPRCVVGAIDAFTESFLQVTKHTHTLSEHTQLVLQRISRAGLDLICVRTTAAAP